MTVDAGHDIGAGGAGRPQSLGTAAARNLATTTKSAPQMQGISSRWLLRMLPWVNVAGGTYRVNRRLSHAVGRGRVGFAQTADRFRVVPPTLRELPLLRGFDDEDVLAAIADRFAQRAFAPGEVIAEAGRPADEVYLVAHGKINKLGDGKYGDRKVVGVLADGDHFGDETLTEDDGRWAYSATASTAGTLMVLTRRAFRSLVEQSPELLVQIAQFLAGAQRSTNRHGEAEIELSSGHEGEIDLPNTYVDYELAPREYELSVAQTVLRVHSRVADLYNEPMNQIEQQLKLTVEALRERQEHELVNNPEFGLLHNADHGQRIHTHHGPPTPDDMDELLSRRRDTTLLLAHPRTIAAFGRECGKRGLYPDAIDLQGTRATTWRGVPVLPCDKIPIQDGHISSVLAMRLGESNQGVIGLHQIGLPDEFEPSLSVRFMGIDEKAIISYLVSAYYSAAVLVPDALGVLENVEIARPSD
ncbi:cyclic nucleotide-binding domain-containing protein [Yinghuangia sp. ASG 101]|uniref:family 2B encapsulin nanocompartment shell protein n=1 Tax=Yinghuangia sp. ASG 101 TaxID=2896848 RepID=UPI001E53638A|nr:family 2B encapsulin nanocompartment shell protein [Yinghuangia sp. ASG 101]UGQ10882.1 cyclic nucleotide-binding domain-containing protein [Yinghuangia sp. ASG 101]